MRQSERDRNYEQDTTGKILTIFYHTIVVVVLVVVVVVVVVVVIIIIIIITIMMIITSRSGAVGSRLEVEFSIQPSARLLAALGFAEFASCIQLYVK